MSEGRGKGISPAAVAAAEAAMVSPALTRQRLMR